MHKVVDSAGVRKAAAKKGVSVVPQFDGSRREKNKMAARRCRQRKQAAVLALEEELTQLKQSKKQLETILQKSTASITKLTRYNTILMDVARQHGMEAVAIRELMAAESREELALLVLKDCQTEQSCGSSDTSHEYKSPPGVVTTGATKPSEQPTYEQELTDAHYRPIVMSRPAVITNFSYPNTLQKGVVDEATSSDLDELIHNLDSMSEEDMWLDIDGCAALDSMCDVDPFF